MAFNDDDESASLALAHQLQAEFDRLAHDPSSSQYQQSPLLDDTHKSSFKRLSEDPGDGPNWRVHISDEEYARQLQAEENATYTPPMSDEEFARLLQMQEVEVLRQSRKVNSSPKSLLPLLPHRHRLRSHGHCSLQAIQLDTMKRIFNNPQ